MLVEAILLIAIVATGFFVVLDKLLYPRGTRLFRSKPKLVVFSQTVFPVLVVVLLIRSFTFEAYRIPSGSMKPTLVEGDLVVVDKYSHGLRLPILGTRLTPGQPKRGDVVVFRGDLEGEKVGIIKRIVGLPGDHVKYQNRMVYVNGEPAIQLNINTDVENNTKVITAIEDLGNMQHDIMMALQNENINYPYSDVVVPKDSYFVLGDHRSNSDDSRYWGMLSDSKLIGKARLIAFSVDWPNKSVRWKRIGKID